MNIAALSIAALRRGGPAPVDAGGGIGGPGLRTAPSAEWDFLLGPQVAPETTLSGVTTPPNMIEYFTKRMQGFVDVLTSSPGFVTTPGSVAVVNGSDTITYTGTFADSGLAANGFCKINDTEAGIDRYYRVLSVNSGAKTAVLAGYGGGHGSDLEAKTWPGSTQGGLTLSRVNPSFLIDGHTNATNAYATLSYYDTAHALYQAWAAVDNFATGSTYLSLARELVDHYVDSDFYGGLVIPGPTYGFDIYPRGSNLYSAICRAHDGRPELFAGIDAKMSTLIYAWLSRNQVGGPLETEGFNTRDGAYVLEFCALLGVVHPVTVTRNNYRDQAISLALDPCLRTSNPTPKTFGASNEYMRWLNFVNFDANDNGFYDVGDFEGGMTNDGVVGGGGTGASQPFQDSIMLSALRAVMQMMQYHSMDSGANWDTIRAGFIAGTRAWVLTYINGTTKPGYGLARYVAYWSGMNTHYQKVGAAVAGAAVNYSQPFITLVGAPATFGVQDAGNGSDVNDTLSSRQGLGDGMVNLGFAYELTGESGFKAMLNETLDSAFGARYVLPPSEGGGTYDIIGGDGRMSLYQANTPKNWNQHYGNGQCMKGLGYVYRKDNP